MPAQYGQIDLPAELNLGKPSPMARQNTRTTKAPIIILHAATWIGEKDSNEILTAKKEKPQMNPKKKSKHQLFKSLFSVFVVNLDFFESYDAKFV